MTKEADTKATYVTKAETANPDTLDAASKVGKAAPIMRKNAVMTKVTR